MNEFSKDIQDQTAPKEAHKIIAKPTTNEGPNRNQQQITDFKFKHTLSCSENGDCKEETRAKVDQ
jgi:hypothetical protein